MPSRSTRPTRRHTPAWRSSSVATSSRKALELAPELAESHVARGHVHRTFRRYEEAEREFQETLRINPNSFDAVDYHARMSQDGLVERARAAIRRAVEVGPDDPGVLYNRSSPPRPAPRGRGPRRWP
jgi:tetratricopeptide (TPR) repeat protein